MNRPRFSIPRIQNAFGHSSGHYEQHAQLQKDIGDECLQTVRPYWPAGARILDLGTGTGALAQTAKHQNLHWHITGLDIAAAMCACSRLHNDYVVNANAEFLPFADASFDGVFSSLMMQWSNNPLQLFKEMLRVTRQGGNCVLSSFTYGTLTELRETFASLNAATHVNDFAPPNYFSALAVHAGFTVLSSEETTVTEYYPDMLTVMRGLKAIGASTKQHGKQQPGLMTPRQLKKLEDHYREHYASKDGLPATWQLMILLLEKP